LPTRPFWEFLIFPLCLFFRPLATLTALSSSFFLQNVIPPGYDARRCPGRRRYRIPGHRPISCRRCCLPTPFLFNARQQLCLPKLRTLGDSGVRHRVAEAVSEKLLVFVLYEPGRSLPVNQTLVFFDLRRSRPLTGFSLSFPRLTPADRPAGLPLCQTTSEQALLFYLGVVSQYNFSPSPRSCPPGAWGFLPPPILGSRVPSGSFPLYLLSAVFDHPSRWSAPGSEQMQAQTTLPRPLLRFTLPLLNRSLCMFILTQGKPAFFAKAFRSPFRFCGVGRPNPSFSFRHPIVFCTNSISHSVRLFGGDIFPAFWILNHGRAEVLRCHRFYPLPLLVFAPFESRSPSCSPDNWFP